MTFRSGSNHPRFVPTSDLLASLKKLDLGSLEITGHDIQRGKHRMVETTCSSCRTTKMTSVDNIMSGYTTNCKCHRAVKTGSEARGEKANPKAKVLGERFDAMHQRCNNPKDANYLNYGGRGVQLKFAREGFIRWALEKLPHTDYRGVEFDRINNDGDYEPGNLRLVSKPLNLRNRRTSRYVHYLDSKVNASDLWHLLKTDYPEFALSQGTTAKLAKQGVPVDEILKRKARGAYTLGKQEQVDPAIIALYRK